MHRDYRIPRGPSVSAWACLERRFRSRPGSLSHLKDSSDGWQSNPIQPQSRDLEERCMVWGFYFPLFVSTCVYILYSCLNLTLRQLDQMQIQSIRKNIPSQWQLQGIKLSISNDWHLWREHSSGWAEDSTAGKDGAGTSDPTLRFKTFL